MAREMDSRLWRVRKRTSGDDQREEGEGDKDVESHRGHGRSQLRWTFKTACQTRLNVSTSKAVEAAVVGAVASRRVHASATPLASTAHSPNPGSAG